MRKSEPNKRPPKGAIVGENVPIENQEDGKFEGGVDEVVAQLKLRGRPYTEMSEDEIREKAMEIVKEAE